jgi:hypothetical protein
VMHGEFMLEFPFRGILVCYHPAFLSTPPLLLRFPFGRMICIIF